MQSFISKLPSKLMAYNMLVLAVLPHKLACCDADDDYSSLKGVKSQKIIYKQSVRPIHLRCSSNPRRKQVTIVENN